MIAYADFKCPINFSKGTFLPMSTWLIFRVFFYCIAYLHQHLQCALNFNRQLLQLRIKRIESGMIFFLFLSFLFFSWYIFFCYTFLCNRNPDEINSNSRSKSNKKRFKVIEYLTITFFISIFQMKKKTAKQWLKENKNKRIFQILGWKDKKQ